MEQNWRDYLAWERDRERKREQEREREEKDRESERENEYVELLAIQKQIGPFVGL